MKFATPIALAMMAAPTAMAWNSMGPLFFPGPDLETPMLKRQRALANRMMEETDMLKNHWGMPSSRYEVIDNDEKFQVSVDVPGVKPEDMSISLEDGYLTVKAQRLATSGNSRFASKFSQSFSLDPAVDLDGFEANLENGVLVVSAPKDVKKLEENVRRIPINILDPASEPETTPTIPEASTEAKVETPVAQEVEAQDELGANDIEV